MEKCEIIKLVIYPNNYRTKPTFQEKTCSSKKSPVIDLSHAKLISPFQSHDPFKYREQVMTAFLFLNCNLTNILEREH